MFRDRAHAREVIQQIAVDEADDEPISADQIEVLLDGLLSQFWIARNETAGATRFGGAPDLPPGTSRPIRKALPNAERTADDLHIHKSDLAKTDSSRVHAVYQKA